MFNKIYRAAAIGATGQGDYGHGLDRVFVDLPGVEFVAIADENAAGLERAAARCGVEHTYTDFRKMLEMEKPDLVSVAMRWPGLHEERIIAAAEAGCHIYSEKPLAPDLAAADRMLAACRRNKVKIAVAQQNRVSPAVRKALEMVRGGDIGEILALRGCGKCDSRGGGQDLMVLGTHMLDLMRLFAGNPQWTFAHVTQDGRDVTKADAVPGDEMIGPIAGDRLFATYGFPGGVHGTFESYRGLSDSGDRFGLEIHGSNGIVTMRSLRDVMLLRRGVFNPVRENQWEVVTTPLWERLEEKSHWCNQQMVLDLIRAAEQDREPVCSGDDARWTLEMIQSVYAAHLAGGRVALPLEPREHSLG